MIIRPQTYRDEIVKRVYAEYQKRLDCQQRRGL